MNECASCERMLPADFGIFLRVVDYSEQGKVEDVRERWYCDKCRIADDFHYVTGSGAVLHSPCGVGQV